VIIIYKTLTTARWDAFEKLFGKKGACGGCWCMLWRSSPADFKSRKGEGNRAAMHQLVKTGNIPGLLAFHDGEPVGWCALAPRSDYPALTRSRVMKPVDDQPCWSVSCLFVRRDHRKRGVATGLLNNAVKHARSQGAQILEGYPTEPGEKNIPAAFAWTGIPSAFEKAGFTEVARRSPTRPIMRIIL